MTGLLDAIQSGGSQVVVGNGAGGPTGGAGPIERSMLARPVLPCPGCAHAPVCSIRPLLELAELGIRTPPAPHEAIRIALAVSIECAHFLAGETPAPEPAPIRQTMTDRQVSARRGTEASRKMRATAKPPTTGGGSGEAAEPSWPGADRGAARAHRGGYPGELRSAPDSGWIGA